MKQILLAYVLVSLLTIAIISVLSFGHGAGYIYIYWHEWQIQSNIWFMVFVLALLSCTAQLIWYGVKR